MSEELLFPEAGLPKPLDSISIFRKSSIKKNAVESAKNVKFNYVQEFIKAKIASDWLDEYAKTLKDYAIEEYESNGDVLNLPEKLKAVSIERGNTATKYDFSHDEEWVKLNEQLKEIKEKIKEREELMKTAIKFSEVVDKNGEIVKPAKIITHGTPYLRIKY